MDKYGLVGYPLKHSFSRRFFSEKFEKEAIDAEYVNFEIPSIEEFSAIVTDSNLRGLNVTIPYKEQVIPFLDELDENAKEIGAVNVIEVKRVGGVCRLIGHNSDVIGFQNSIAPLINKEIHHKALILGTGGASKAVVQGLRNLGLETKYVSRTKREDGLTYEDLTEAILKEYAVIVNASPIGTFPVVDECPAIPYEYLGATHLLYDLVYNPAETLFLQKGKAQGAKIKNGEEMLHLQALAAWEMWGNK